MDGEEFKNRGWFPKGISGNPKGRPRKSRHKTKAMSILNRKISMKIDGETVKVHPQIAVMVSLLNLGLKGNSSAMETFLSERERLHRYFPAASRIRSTVRTSIRPRSCDWELNKLGLFEKSGGVCTIAPWVLKEAVRHNPALDLGGIDRTALLSPFENKSTALKLLNRMGLSPEK